MMSAPSSQSPNNSLAYLDGRVYTVDPKRPWIEAFIVSPKGRFIAVGSTSEIKEIALRDKLITFDLRGRFIMPGLHDAHTHLLFGTMALTSEANIGFDSTAHDIAKRIKEGSCACKYAHVFQDWIIASMLNNAGFPDQKADRKYLDEEFPDIPVAVRGGAAHSLLLNTKALKVAGYDIENEPDTQGSKFFRREDGSLTGELAENAMTKAFLAMPKPALSHAKRVLKEGIRKSHSCGITSIQEASANVAFLQAMKELEEEGALKMDVAAHIVHGPEHLGGQKKEELIDLIEKADRWETKHLDPQFVKIILDGVPIPPLFTHCGLDSEGKADWSKICVEDFRDAIIRYDKMGKTVKIHCTGHGSTRLVLDAIEEARRNNPNGPRHEVAHNSGVNDEDYTRYKPLNVTAEMSPAMFFTHPLTASSNGLMDWNFNKMMNMDAHLTIGSDLGAGDSPALFQPCAETARSIGAEKVLEMLTINGAVAVGKEKERGSIEVGKKANFISVNRDLIKDGFEGATVLGTWFEGEMVFEREE